MPRARRSRSILANQSSTWLSHDEYVGVKCEMHVRMLHQERPDRLGLVRRQVVDDDVNRAGVGCVATMSPRKSTNAALVWRGTVWPTTSPDSRVRARRSNESVP